MKPFLATFFLTTLLLAPPSWAAVSYDATASSVCGNDGALGLTACTSTNTVLTYALTMSANANRQLAVWVFLSCGGGNTPPSLSSVTYAGTTLTQITTATQATSNKGFLFAWPTGSQPTTGANNVVVTLASDFSIPCPDGQHNSLGSGAISAYGVDQTTTFSSTNTATGIGTSLSLTLAGSNANDLGIHAACHGDDLASTTETSRWSRSNNHASCGSDGGATAAGGDTSLSWTASASDSWIMLGGAFKAAVVSAGTTGTFLLLGVGN